MQEKVIIMDTTPAVSQSTNNGHGYGSTNHSKLNLHLPLENTNAPADFTLKPKDENSSNKKSERSDKKEQSPTSSTSSGNIVTSTTPSSSSSRTSTLAKLAAAKSAAKSTHYATNQLIIYCLSKSLSIDSSIYDYTASKFINKQ